MQIYVHMFMQTVAYLQPLVVYHYIGKNFTVKLINT